MLRPLSTSQTILLKTSSTHVDTNDRTNHLRDDDHVSQVSLDHSWLLVGAGLLLSVSELLDETHRAALKTALEPPSGTSVNKLRGGKKEMQGVRSDRNVRWRKGECGQRHVPFHPIQ